MRENNMAVSSRRVKGREWRKIARQWTVFGSEWRGSNGVQKRPRWSGYSEMATAVRDVRVLRDALLTHSD